MSFSNASAFRARSCRQSAPSVHTSSIRPAPKGASTFRYFVLIDTSVFALYSQSSAGILPGSPPGPRLHRARSLTHEMGETLMLIIALGAAKSSFRETELAARDNWIDLKGTCRNSSARMAYQEAPPPKKCHHIYCRDGRAQKMGNFRDVHNFYTRALLPRIHEQDGSKRYSPLRRACSRLFPSDAGSQTSKNTPPLYSSLADPSALLFWTFIRSGSLHKYHCHFLSPLRRLLKISVTTFLMIRCYLISYYLSSLLFLGTTVVYHLEALAQRPLSSRQHQLA